MSAVDAKVHTKARTVLEAWEAAWNASDMNAMWLLATDEIHWVNVVGHHWRGKAEVQKAHQVNFDQLFKDRTCKLEEIESIEPLPGGAVVAVVRWQWADIDDLAELCAPRQGPYVASTGATR